MRLRISAAALALVATVLVAAAAAAGIENDSPIDALSNFISSALGREVEVTSDNVDEVAEEVKRKYYGHEEFDEVRFDALMERSAEYLAAPRRSLQKRQNPNSGSGFLKCAACVCPPGFVDQFNAATAGIPVPPPPAPVAAEPGAGEPPVPPPPASVAAEPGAEEPRRITANPHTNHAWPPPPPPPPAAANGTNGTDAGAPPAPLQQMTIHFKPKAAFANATANATAHGTGNATAHGTGNATAHGTGNATAAAVVPKTEEIKKLQKRFLFAAATIVGGVGFSLAQPHIANELGAWGTKMKCGKACSFKQSRAVSKQGKSTYCAVPVIETIQ